MRGRTEAQSEKAGLVYGAGAAREGTAPLCYAV